MLRHLLRAAPLRLPIVLASLVLVEGCKDRARTVSTSLDRNERRWTQIDSLSELGLYASALVLTDEVLADVNAQGEDLEAYKAWMYRARYRQFTGATTQDIVAELERAVSTAAQPLCALLHSVLAETYWEYYLHERWAILERTNTVVLPEDMDTWGQQAFMQHVIHHHQQALLARDILVKIPTDGLRSVLVQASDASLRPTLYDVLAHRALQAFTHPETRLKEPAGRFSLNRKADFDLFEDHAYRPIQHRDSTAWEWQAMDLFKDLARLHLSDDDPSALVDLELKRLSFVRERSTLPDKEQRYLEALRLLASRVVLDSSWSEVIHAQAQWHAERGGSFIRHVNGPFKHENDTAVALCQRAMARFPMSHGARQCAVLEQQLLRPVMELYGEEGVLPEQDFKVLLEHRNLRHVWWRLVKGELSDLAPDRGTNDALIKLKPFRTGTFTLPDHGDRNSHTVELPFEGLPQGAYVLLVSSGEAFEEGADLMAHLSITATRVSFVERQLPDGRIELLVLDRSNGSPLTGAEVQRFAQQRQGGRVKFIEREKHISDGEGKVVFTTGGERGQMRWEVVAGGDRSFSTVRYVRPHLQREQLEQERTFLFLDRAIYRPGQTLHFKGIVVRGKAADHHVLMHSDRTIALHDANGERVQELTVTTDAYGSFSGSFMVPQGRLLGDMSLREAHGTASFRVEEYKRPRFKVLVDEPRASPVVGEWVTASGQAVTFSGVPVDGARVRWRVLREAERPWWCGWGWRFGLPWGRSVQVAQGEGITDAEGRYSLDFLADPDPSLPREASPLYRFRVEVEVTDINGETQNGQGWREVGYSPFHIELDLRAAMDRNRLDSLRAMVVASQGHVLSIPLDVRISRIAPPQDRPLRNRRWERPDGFLLDRAMHDQRFPHDPYDAEEDPLQWPEEEVVYERTIKDVVALPGAREFRVGDYRIDLVARDSLGRKAEVSEHFVLFDPDIQWTGFTGEAFHVEGVRTTVAPGEKAQLLLSTALPEVSVLMEVERQGQLAVRRRMSLRKGQQLVELPVQEADRGGFVVHFVCAERGILHMSSASVHVPWDNKQLGIEWLRFRDEVGPGEPVEWRLRITGGSAGSSPPQLLATMYDASLDHFVPHYWSAPPLWPSYTPRYRWTRSGLFEVRTARHVWRRSRPLYPPVRSYPLLDLFGYIPGGYGSPVFMSMGISDDTREMARDKLEAWEGDVEDEEAGSGSMDGRDLGDQLARESAGMRPVVRRDLRETAFFQPDLLADRDGSLLLRFSMPQSLTQWRMLGLAHTPDLRFGSFDQKVITTSPLMVVPHLPRTLRERDRITLTSKVLATKDRVEGTAILQVFDPVTNKDLTAACGVEVKERTFIATPGQGALVAWDMQVPEGVGALAVRIVARGGGGPMGGTTFADGEEHVLPVLSERVLITESLPISIDEAGEWEFTHTGLANSHVDGSIQHRSLRFEFTSSPAWQAVQALPYLMEHTDACAEQVFSRYYANRLAAHLVASDTRVKEVFDRWSASGSESFLSALERDPDLKRIALQETPWLLEASEESERKRQLAIFMDTDRLANEERNALRQLADMQMADGPWAWFSGMFPSRFITQHIVAGFGHMDALGATDVVTDGVTKRMIERAVEWLDEQVAEEHQERIARSTPKELLAYRPGHLELHYLYARSFFLRWKPTGQADIALEFLRSRVSAEWLEYGLQDQTMIALALHR
ncbi:MAG: hypothetical protein KDB88_00060, partial [Flavobacteriales bacterium]|nr:hypothetical protein [Flavobacteriales bacterium]